MRLILLILFVGAVLSEEQITKEADKKVEEDVKDIKKSIEEPKSKTEKRDSSDQTGSYGLNSNDEPFKPMLSSNTAAYEVAASATQQQVYYDKNQLTADEGANTKGTINRQAAGNAYRGPHSQVVYQQQQPQEQYQQQQQHQQNKQHLRIVGKNAGIQQNQPNILYAVPHNGAYNYERNPQQQPQQQQQYLQQHISVQQQPGQRGSQKQLQYVVAIPLSYLRQLQQQLLYEQQEQSAAASPTHLQVNKGQQIAHVAQQQQQQQPSYAIAGPLARDNYGAYRPFHRFSPAAVNDVANGQHQAIAPPLIPAAPAPPGYITQYIQIPASVLLAAAQTAQVQQRPLNIQHQSAAYQQQPPQQQQHQQQLQHTQAQSPQLYYYQPQQHQHQFQQQPQLKQSQTSHALTSPPLYEYHTQQQPNQQHQALQHIPEYQHLQQQQQANVGKQQHQQQQRIEGVRQNANLSPSQHATIYEQEQAQLAAIHAQTHAQTHYSTLLHAHKQPTQELTAPQAQLLTQSPATGHKVVQAITPAQQQQQHQVSADPYEPVVHYNPQYVQHYQQQQQQQQQQQRVKYQQSPHPQHRLQIQHPLPPHQQPPLVENINYLSYSQGIHGPTPLPFLRLPAAAGAGAVAPHMAPQPSQLTPYYNYNLISPAMHHQPFVSSALQPSFAPLGMPSKVTSFTNVLLQPFVGQHSSYHTSEMGSAASADSLPFFNHHTGGIHYGTHLYHPPTPATAIASNKQLNLGSASSKPAPRSAVAAVSTAGESKQIAAATTTSAKSSTTSAGSQTIVKYP